MAKPELHFAEALECSDGSSRYTFHRYLDREGVAGRASPVRALRMDPASEYTSYYEKCGWQKAPDFTKPGNLGDQIYGELRNRIMELLHWDRSSHEGSDFSTPKHRNSNERVQKIVPSFLRAVERLVVEDQEDVSVVFRTFGEDMPEVRSVFEAFARGRHPNFLGMRELQNSNNLFIHHEQ